jgi:hypothetical protein
MAREARPQELSVATTITPLPATQAPGRKSGLFLWALGLGGLLFALTFVHAALTTRAAAADIAQRRDLVAALDLTDLALFTEARYTRHPSQADLHSAFQDHPLALDHFPTGTLVPAPRPGLEAAAP